MNDNRMPDQRATSDQLDDVAAWARKQGHLAVAAWIDDPRQPKPTREDITLVLTFAVSEKMYDAGDCLKRRVTGRLW